MATFTFLTSDFLDDLGPEKVVHVYDPSCGLKAILVIDNTACGPSIGGIRMAADVSTDEVFRLARAMTMKNAAAGLAHGGGKSGIVADPRCENKTDLIRAFARAIRDLQDYIPGPDMGTDEICMARIHNEIGRAVGLPRVLGGIPLDEIGATGYGLAECAEVCCRFCDVELRGARVAIEGFGNVGRHAARFLVERGARLVAASDSQGAIFNADGIDVQSLAAAKTEFGTVASFEQGERVSQAALLTVPCDILIPAARPDSIHQENALQIQTKLILQGANIPATPDAERVLHQRGILNVPDFIANAGGVICAAAEYHDGTETQALETISSMIRRNTEEVLQRSREEQILPRQAAIDMATERVRSAMSLR